MAHLKKALPGEGVLVYRIKESAFGNAKGPPDEVYLYRPGGTVTTTGAIESAPLSGNSGEVCFYR